MGEYGVIDNEIAGEQIDWEHMMFDENQEADLSLFDPSLLSDISLPLPNDPNLFNLSSDSFPLSIAEIEQLLMLEEEDDNNAAFTNKVVADQQAIQFSNDFLSDCLRDSPVESDCSVEVVAPIDGGKNSSSATCSEEEEQDKIDVLPQKENNEGNGGYPISKKKQRQLRNRDAAVRSRERKKMYVRDLELKSRYLEGECKRLGILLQCCVAENQALRLSLQNAKGFDASTTKQESAVLLLESLLLGSLLWFLGIVCLLILPRPLQSTLEAVPPENADRKNQGSLVPRKAENKIFRHRLFWSFIVSKRCKASRSRMKPSSHGLGVLA